jgi:3-deoxy-7-phosphoheptulonate synthase
MIIPKAGKLIPEQLAEVERIAGEFDCSILEIVGRNRCIYAILGDEGRELMFNRLRGLDYLARVDLIESPYKSMDRKSALAEHQVKVGKTSVGAGGPFFHWRSLYRRSGRT